MKSAPDIDSVRAITDYNKETDEFLIHTKYRGVVHTKSLPFQQMKDSEMGLVASINTEIIVAKCEAIERVAEVNNGNNTRR